MIRITFTGSEGITQSQDGVTADALVLKVYHLIVIFDANAELDVFLQRAGAYQVLTTNVFCNQCLVDVPVATTGAGSCQP